MCDFWSTFIFVEDQTCIASLYTCSEVSDMATNDRDTQREWETSRVFLSTTWAVIIETKPKWQHDDYKHTLNEKPLENYDKNAQTQIAFRKRKEEQTNE